MRAKEFLKEGINDTYEGQVFFDVKSGPLMNKILNNFYDDIDFWAGGYTSIPKNRWAALKQFVKGLNGQIFNVTKNYLDFTSMFSDDNKLYEGLSHEKTSNILHDFIEFAADKLELTEFPKFNFSTGHERSVKNSSFGGYGNHSINITISNRHINDVLRTLAHEMVHFKQDLNNELDGPDPGATGSPQENEANAQAAVILRAWGKKHPELFALPAIE